MGATSQQQPRAAAGERNTSTSAKSTSKGASRSQNPTQSQGAAGSKARSQFPARQSTTGAGGKTVREDPKDKEIRELKDMIKELTATIKELRASIRHPKKTSDNEDAAEPTQLAQRPRTYADAAAKGKSSSVQKSQESSQSSAYTAVKMRSAVKVLGKPKDVGMPVQPTHGVAAEEARTWQASALLPLQLWKEAENKQLGLPVLNPNKPPAEWKVSERPGTFQRVLMLGGTADSCAELADMAFTSHPQVEYMAAIVNVPNTAGVKKATVADALRRMRLTRADLDVQGCLLTLATRITRAEWVHSEGPLRPIADQQLWMQWERTTMEQDDESDHQESDTAEHAPVMPSERESGFHKISLQIDPLMCSDSELPPNRTKGSAQRWVRQQTMEYLKTCMQEMTQAPPMAIFRRAEHYSVTMELPLEAAKRVGQATRHRGKAVDVERIPWTWTGSTHSLAESPQHEELQQHMGDPSLPVLVCRCADRGHCRQVGCPNMGNRRTKRAAKDRYCKPAWSRGPHQTDTHTGVRIPGRFRLRYHVGSRGGRTCLSLRQGPSSLMPTPRQHVNNQAGLRHYRDRGANGMAGAQAGVHRHQSKPTNLEAVRIAQTPTSSGKSWTPREATSGHTGGRRPRDYLFARRRGGQPRHGVRTIMLTVRVVALLHPRTCTSRYKQPPCYASRTRPPRGKSSGFLLCMLCLLPRCSNHRQCCHTATLSARKCPPTELTREDAMRTARARSPEMMLPLPGLSPPRTCDCRLDCLFLMTGTMFSSMGRSHKRRRSDSSSEEGGRQHRRRRQPQ